jgi:hypothetical protein
MSSDRESPSSESALPEVGSDELIDGRTVAERQSPEASGVERSSMLPPRRERPQLESVFVRVVATCGVIGIGVALGAILASQHVEGWIIGLVVALVSVLISAVLWSSRRL